MRMSNGKINSKTIDMARVDETAELGATEIWDIRNLVGMDPPFTCMTISPRCDSC